MKGYGQFCPIAKATEILGERWTPLIIRELSAGGDSFNKLRRGLPLISPTLLSARLKTLEHKGVILRRRNGRGISYELTAAGRELKPIIEAMGVWGHRWVRSDLSKGDLDPSLLMWDIHRNLDTAQFRGRVVLLFEFQDYVSRYRRWWLVVEEGEVDVCMKDPGYEIDLQLLTDVKTLTAVWMGDEPLRNAIDSRSLRLTGQPELIHSIETWLGSSSFAQVTAAL